MICNPHSKIQIGQITWGYLDNKEMTWSQFEDEYPTWDDLEHDTVVIPNE